MKNDKTSSDSLMQATQGRASFSKHGGLGAAGYVSDTDDNAYQFLGTTGQTEIFNPQEGGYERLRIGAAWQNIHDQKKGGLVNRLFKKPSANGVDLDLGCLYELQDGRRGAIQAFGDLFGDYNDEPYISLSGDDRTGDDDDDDDGEDEVILINGQKWPEIKRVIFYLYIYDGASHWAEIRPQVQIRVSGEKPMIVNLHTYNSELAVCTVAEMENVRNGIRLTNHTEYYPGHAEMDRALGFGLEWGDGSK
jgi:tellurite resistance protein TerA